MCCSLCSVALRLTTSRRGSRTLSVAQKSACTARHRMCIHNRFRLMPGKNVRSFRCSSNMGRSSGRISTNRFLQRIYWNWWSGIFSQDLRHWKSSTRSRKTCKNKTLNLKDLKIESSSCRCSTTSKGQRNAIQNNVSQIPKQVKNYAKKFSQGNWTFLGPESEKKWYGNTSYLPEGKWPATANLMVEEFEASGHPVDKCLSAGSWNFEEEEQEGDHTLHCGCSKHRALTSNDSLSKSAQYLRSNRKLVWQNWSDARWKASENDKW